MTEIIIVVAVFVVFVTLNDYFSLQKMSFR
jgi:hypothetical protein